MQARPVRLLARITVAGAAVLALAGCPDDAADITEIKATSLDFDVAPVAALDFPVGALSVDRLLLAAFDTTVVDAFGRETDSNFGFVLFGGDPADPEWVFDAPLVRNLDPRAPTLIATTPVGTNGTGLFIDPPPNEGLNHYFFIISGSLSGLPPNTTFTVALVRLGTDVKAELDQAAVLQGLAITQPDSLVILNPNPLGDPNVVLGVGPATVNRGDTVFAQAGANPMIIGHASSDANGNSDFGIDLRCDTSGGTPVFFCSDGVPISTTALNDSSLFGRNDGVAYSLPRYNYVVLYQGIVTPTDATPVVARWQTGQDMDLTGQPINNGAAPFPPGAFTNQQLISAPGGAGRPDSITVEFRNLEALSGGAQWQLWMVNRDESPPTMAPAMATYDRIAILRSFDPITGELLSESDSIIETVTTSSFAGQKAVKASDGTVSEVKHRFTITDATTGGGTNAPGFFTDIMVTIESGAGAATPSSARALWFQYTDQSGTPTNFFDDASTSGTLQFGNFVPTDPALSRVFTGADFIQSSGFGGVLGDGQVSVDIRNLPLPPVGFFYEGWLLSAAGDNELSGIAVSMGPLTTLPPDTVSLFDADIDQSITGVTATGIRFANAMVKVDPTEIVDADLVPRLTTFALTLEPKASAAGKSPTELEIGALPIAAIIDRRK